MNHLCTLDECGHVCWLEDSQPTREVHYTYDYGDIDGEGPCGCELHDG